MDDDSFYKSVFVWAMAVSVDLYATLVVFHGWEWHAVPLGLPVIGYAHMFGLVFLKAAISGYKSTGDLGSGDLLKLCWEKGAHFATLHLFMWLASGAT